MKINAIVFLTLSALSIGIIARADLPPGDVYPVVLKQVMPVYPSLTAKARIRTEVLVEFIVEKDGTVQIAKIVSDSKPPYSTSALECVKKWTFKPGLKAGVPVRCLMRVPIVFEKN